MQSHDMRSPDWQDLLGLDPGANLSPVSNPFTDSSPQRHTLHPAAPQRVRPRNRNPRSCDFCRTRKTACIIKTDPPCNACNERGLECTFTERRRVRRAAVLEPAHDVRQGTTRHDVSPFSYAGVPDVSIPTATALSLPWQTGTEALPQSFMQDRSMEIGIEEPNFFESQRFEPQVSPDPDVEPTVIEQPLDKPLGTFCLLGESGEADPHLLKHSSSLSHTEHFKYRRVYRDRNLANGHDGLDCQRPLIFMTSASILNKHCEPRVEEDDLRKIRTELDCIDSKVGIRLVKLYFKYVYPYFPVISRSRMLQDYGLAEDTVSDLPVSLKAALYACALPFVVYDDVLSTMLDTNLPNSKTLTRMCWIAITQEIHSPRLSTMQACLLLLQRDKVDRNEHASPFQSSLMAWTVSLAQSLGFATDCSTVRGIPAWEKRLRKRTWWATYTLDKWMFSLAGLPSHIRVDDFDVLPLKSEDFESDGKGSNILSPDTTTEPTHFQLLVDLTLVLADTIDAFYTIRASKATAGDFTKTYRLANDFNSRLEEWKVVFDQFTNAQRPVPIPRTRIDGGASLHIAYWAVRLMLSRAMLRSLSAASGTFEDKELREHRRESVRHEAESCCGEVVEFVENLSPGSWNCFWHKFSPSNFALASSVMMRLLVTSTSPVEKSRLHDLIDRWRWVLRSGGGNVGGNLTSLALLRLDRSLVDSNLDANTSPMN